MPRIPELRLATHTLTIGGRTWQIRAAADQDALLAQSDAFSVFPFGLLLWESAVAIAEALALAPEQARGRSVLELGAGVGLAGLVAASLGAHVTQSDHAAEALALAAGNAEANGVTGIVSVAADWQEWSSQGRYDLVIGADILYDRAVHAPLRAIFARNLATGGKLLLADPGRHDTPEFLRSLAEAGWRITTRSMPVPRLARSPDESAAVDVTLITASRD